MSAKHMTKEQLTEIVQAEAAKHGYKEAEACFVGIKDLKVKWNRTLSWISLEFSDYLDTLPPSAIKALVADTFKTIKTGKAGHSAAFLRSLGSKKFRTANRDKYLSRCKIVYGPVDNPNVYAAPRLSYRGMIEPPSDLAMVWGHFPVDCVPFKASGAFRTIIFNTSLYLDERWDQKPIDEDCLDYLVYCGILRASCIAPTSEDYERMRALARAYPNRDSILARLAQASISGVFE